MTNVRDQLPAAIRKSIKIVGTEVALLSLQGRRRRV